MELRVITKDGNKHLRNLKVGELVLCDDNNFYPIRHIAVISDMGYSIRLSNNMSFNTHDRLRIKTEKGFKFPELWDSIPLSKKLIPMVTRIILRDRIKFFYDILIDRNMVSPEGIIFKFGD